MITQSHVFARVPLSAGLVLGVFPLPLHLFLSPHLSVQMAALTLVLIAGVYIGYGFKDGRPHIIWLELGTAVVFALAAWAGLNGYPYVIPAALALHGFWDLLHHNIIETDVPRWFIPFCVVCDWVMAAGLALVWALPG